MEGVYIVAPTQIRSVMKPLYYLPLLFLVGCTATHKKDVCYLSNTPLDTVQMEQHLLDDNLIFPAGMSSFDKYVVFMEDNNPNGIYHFFSDSTFKFLFSAGEKGHAKDEFICPLHNYFEATDSSFSVLDMNEIREFRIENKKLININKVNIPSYNTINQLVHVAKDEYIMAGDLDGEAEHIKIHDGNLSEFGVFPEKFERDNWIRNRKLTAGRPDKKYILDFYVYHNRVRMYDSNGNLYKDIIVNDSFERNSLSSDIASLNICFYRICYNSDYIVAVYGNSKNNKEIQIWTWDGLLRKRLFTGQGFTLMCLSEDDTLYAIDSEKPNVLFSYKI